MSVTSTFAVVSVTKHCNFICWKDTRYCRISHNLIFLLVFILAAMHLKAVFERMSVIMSDPVDDYPCFMALVSILTYFIIITINSLFLL